MSNEKIKRLFANLQDEIRSTELDDETRSMLSELDADIAGLLSASETAGDTKTVVERARLLETRFATDHPTAEGFIREIIDTLARMGI
ncbi:MAG: DUF4404 family protein [Gammaproteobacteria bacterium]|nr:DUF4404 family protein [Gammaproteobacteria bacterium]